MRKMLIVGLLYLLAGTLLVPSAGYAQEVRNEIGLYTDLSASPSATSIDAAPNVPFEVYMLVTDPYNEEFTPADCGPPILRDVDLINGFQYRMVLSDAGLYEISRTPNSIVGGEMHESLDHFFYLGVPIPVPENRIVLLLTFTFMVLDAGPKQIYLGPTKDMHPHVLAVYDYEEFVGGSGCSPRPDTSQSVSPVSGDSDSPVFGINASVVATESESWGNVKTLYR